MSSATAIDLRFPIVVAWISLLVSLGAVVISGLSYLRASRDDRSADPVAFLTTEQASVDGGPIGPVANLGIENRGKHDANDVTISVEFLLANRQVDASGEVKLVTGQTRYPMALTWQRRKNVEPPMNVKLTWSDGRRGRQSRIVAISDYDD